MPIRTVFLTLFAIASPLLGLSMLTQAADAPSPRIVGGSPAADRWPWMAQIIIKEPSGSPSFCGASHLSPRWVLTAYHCTQYLNGDPATADRLFVYIGETEDKLLLPPEGRITVEGIYKNQQRFDNFSFAHDLALLRIPATSNRLWPSLADDDVFNELKNRPLSQRDEAVTALGWGQTGSGERSTVLREVQLDFIPREECKQLSTLSIPDSTICAAELNPVNGINQDTCFGDSGGPLFIGEEGNPWLIGLTSFGLQDCATGAPAGYTHVTAEIAEVERLTTQGNAPLVDMTINGETKRYYQRINGTQAIPITLRNNSINNTATNPAISRSFSGSIATSARFNWTGCSTLPTVTRCTVASSLAASASRTGNLDVTDSSGTDQLVTLTLSASADENDYRRRNNSLIHEIAFSDNPDLALSAVQQTSSRSQASVAVTLSNHSPLFAATNTGISFSLPTNTQLLNGPELGCQQGNPIYCPIGGLGTEQSHTLTLKFATDTGISQLFTFKGLPTEDNNIPGDTDMQVDVTVQYKYNATVSSAAGGGSGGGASLWLGLIALVLGVRRQRN